MAKQTKFFLIATILTIGWMLLMRPYTPGNIVGFEMAKTAPKAEQIIADWGKVGIEKATTSIYLDFGFIIFYVAAISLGCFVAAAYSDWDALAAQAHYFAIAIWIAGALDVIENIAMLKTLHQVNEQTISIAYYTAIVKFILVALAMLFILIASLVGITNRLRS
jgi:hypothetical protein